MNELATIIFPESQWLNAQAKISNLINPSLEDSTESAFLQGSASESARLLEMTISKALAGVTSDVRVEFSVVPELQTIQWKLIEVGTGNTIMEIPNKTAMQISQQIRDFLTGSPSFLNLSA